MTEGRGSFEGEKSQRKMKLKRVRKGEKYQRKSTGTEKKGEGSERQSEGKRVRKIIGKVYDSSKEEEG